MGLPGVDRARDLRREATEAERRLWGLLRNRGVGAKFRRQVTIGVFIADFACLECGLVVEVDGGQHADSSDDLKRTARLEEQGWRVVRFWNDEVLRNLEGVREVILAAVAETSGRVRVGGKR